MSATTSSSHSLPVEQQEHLAVPQEQVDDCVDYVQFGAFTGNQMLSSMWDHAGQNEGQLREDCRQLGLADPAGLAALSKGWTDLEHFFDAAQAAEVAARQSTTTLYAPAPRPPPVVQPVYQAPVEPVNVPPMNPTGGCGDESYINVDGDCVPSPVFAASVPAGATAQCEDGTYSFSRHHQGACSHHGGVAVWL